MITLTKKAADRVSFFLKQNISNIGLRIDVKMSGCAGMKYIIHITNKKHKSDIIFESKGIKIFINKKNMLYFENIELDFVKHKDYSKGFYEGFKINNTKEKTKCNCGKSFNI